MQCSPLKLNWHVCRGQISLLNLLLNTMEPQLSCLVAGPCGLIPASTQRYSNQCTYICSAWPPEARWDLAWLIFDPEDGGYTLFWNVGLHMDNTTLYYRRDHLCCLVVKSSWLQTQWSRARFSALPDFLSSSGTWTESTQPREHKWGAAWKKSSGSGIENWD
jgi:hypothetical protein